MIRTVTSYAPKHFDVNISAQNQSSGGNIGSLSLIPQGAAQSDRIADSIIAHSFHMRWTISTQNADVFNNIRVIVFVWKPSTALFTPVLATILPDTAAVGYQSNLSYPNRDQYHVLFDRTFAMSGTATNPTPTGNYHFEGHHPDFKNMRMEFTPGATTGTNQIFLLSISDSAVVPFPVATYVTRIVYRDE